MHTWPIQNAKAQFSEMLNTCIKEGAQIISRRGINEAVLIPLAEWQRLNNNAQPSLKSLLLSNDARAELTTPPRGQAQRRSPIEL
jgi:prevent-host-death family protein